MKKIAVLYTHIPHYRAPVFEEMAKSTKYRFEFFYSEAYKFAPIKTHESNIGTLLPIYSYKGLAYQTGFIKHITSNNYDGFILLGNANVISMWIYAIFARAYHKPVLFWSHGWLTDEKGIKGYIRDIFYRISNGLLLYGERAKRIGIKRGFSADTLHVIFNSLDYNKQKSSRLLAESNTTVKKHTNYILCIARLTKLVKLDQAIAALQLIKSGSGDKIELHLIGDGPEKDNLLSLAQKANVPVVFHGAIYDEDIIAELIFNARAVVSPGKIGLTAMHSLAYGVPVISHNNFDTQMPEYEAITPDVTGDFFIENNIQSLAEVIDKWIKKPRTEQERKKCIEVIEEKYNPQSQRQLIEIALDSVFINKA